MRSLRHSSVRILCALFTFAIVSGYIVGDAIVDAKNGCAAEASEQSGTDNDCAVCFTCSHGGALVAVDAPVDNAPVAVECAKMVPIDERVLDGPPARIDHPPQLA